MPPAKSKKTSVPLLVNEALVVAEDKPTATLKVWVTFPVVFALTIKALAAPLRVKLPPPALKV
jgi:hypothetical protein